MARRGHSTGIERIDLAFTREARQWAEFQKDADKAKRFALQKLGRSLPVAWRKDIQGDFNLPAKQILERIDVRVDADSVLPDWAAPTDKRSTSADAGPSLKSVARRAACRKRLGAGAPWWPRIIVDDGFIATGKSGNRQIFQRRSIKRLPIRAVYGPSVVSFFQLCRAKSACMCFAAEVFRKELPCVEEVCLMASRDEIIQYIYELKDRVTGKLRAIVGASKAQADRRTKPPMRCNAAMTASARAMTAWAAPSANCAACSPGWALPLA